MKCPGVVTWSLHVQINFKVHCCESQEIQSRGGAVSYIPIETSHTKLIQQAVSLVLCSQALVKYLSMVRKVGYCDYVTNF